MPSIAAEVFHSLPGARAATCRWRCVPTLLPCGLKECCKVLPMRTTFFDQIMSSTVTMDWDLLDRMERAVGKVRERLLRVTSVLNSNGIPYAVVGGHAVASWVTTVDEGAVRNTRDIDLLVQRDDLPILTAALEKAGFVRAEVLDVTVFLDGPDARPSDSIHLLFAGEKVAADHPLPSPSLSTIDDPAGFRVVTLEALVLMKLLSNRDKDRTHVRDLIGVGLIDRSWLAKLPPVLAERLQGILDTPDS